jgi:hypothetical protein
MGLEHLEWPTFGLQFHPESVLTSGGHRLLENFLNLAGLRPQRERDVGELDRLEHRELQPTPSEDWSSLGPLHW